MRRECRPASCAAAWERASHLDKKPSPSVWFTKASIGAELVDAADGDHEALNSKGAKLTDTVRYESQRSGKLFGELFPQNLTRTSCEDNGRPTVVNRGAPRALRRGARLELRSRRATRIGIRAGN